MHVIAILALMALGGAALASFPFLSIPPFLAAGWLVLNAPRSAIDSFFAWGAGLVVLGTIAATFNT